VAVTYLGCFLIYSYFPVVGPRELWPIHQGELTSGFFYQLNLGLRTAGDSLGTAFPSSHTAGAVTFAWIAWRIASPPVAWGMTGLAALIALATIYTQNHFAIDTVAGLLVAGLLQGLVVPSLLARAATHRGAADRVLPSRGLSEAA
jgi:membrane-associated phospholipid phosphatase